MIEDCACGHSGHPQGPCEHKACGCQVWRPASMADLDPPPSASKMRRFILERDVDGTGVSGTGVVAEGVEFTSGIVALTWLSEWPTSVVFHDRGIESVRAIHGHGGNTRIVFVDEVTFPDMLPPDGVPRTPEEQRALRRPGRDRQLDTRREHDR